jgi:phosphoribosylamine---glycine ligase
MNVLLIGSGGREHAIAWKLSQSSLLQKLYIAPGNAGTAQIGENLAIDPLDFAAVKQSVLDHDVQFVVVGPETPLVAGIVDFFRSDSDLRLVPVFGPDKAAAMLEGSKDMAKQFMKRHHIPTARYAAFKANQVSDGCAFLEALQPPYVLKADGLAAGKGVIILEDLQEAKSTLAEMLNGKFGAASETVLVEEFLKGIELSVFAITDGKSYKLLPSAKDYKRIGEGDTGLNTGGMGAISPVPFADAAFMEKVERTIVKPTIEGFAKDGMRYCGFVFFGLIEVQNEPYVIEYNCRMGDPETEVVMPRLRSDLLQLMEAATRGVLADCHVETDERCAATVMMVSGGYPEAYTNGFVLEAGNIPEGVMAFHAGTKLVDGKELTHGGRVMALTGMHLQLSGALELAYAGVRAVTFQNAYWRKDIGRDVMQVI